nr:hypothetical protein [Tanacetum cinerariifolium]
PDESDSKPLEYASSDSDSSVDTTTSMPAIVEDAPKVVSEPKMWTDAPIIKEYGSDSDDNLVSNVPEEKEKPSFAFTNTAKHVKTSRKNDKETGTHNHYLKIEKQDRHSHTRKGASVHILGSLTTFGASSTIAGIEVVVSTLESESLEAYSRGLESDSSGEVCFGP